MKWSSASLKRRRRRRSERTVAESQGRVFFCYVSSIVVILDTVERVKICKSKPIGIFGM